MIKLLSYLMLLGILVSCTLKEKAEAPVDYYEGLPESYASLLKAHGGLDKWRSFKTLEYDLIHPDDSTKNEHYTLDLLNRKDLTVADSFQIGYDGNEVWVAPNKKHSKAGPLAFTTTCIPTSSLFPL